MDDSGPWFEAVEPEPPRGEGDPGAPDAAASDRARSGTRVIAQGSEASSAARIRAQLDAFASEFLLFVSPNLELVAVNFRANALGYAGSEGEGQQITDFIHPEDLPKVFALTDRARRTPAFEEAIQLRAQHKDGSWRMLDVRVFDASLRSDLMGVVLRVRDVTDEHNAKVTASDLDRFSSLAEMLPFGILSADARGWVAYSNEAARHILTLSKEMVSGHGWEQAVHEEDWDDVSAAASRVIAAGISERITFRLATSLFPRWAELKFVPLGSPSEPSGWIATVEDITDRRRAEGELTRQATHDALTGLPNRTLMEDRLDQARNRVQRGSSSSLTAFFVDLDGFKVINDSYGHRVGDAVLVEVARRLTSVVRSADTVARFGGDEFVAVCESLPPGEDAALERRITSAFEPPILVDGLEVTMSASVGCATTTDGLAELSDLLARADDDMYQRKHTRRSNHPD